MLASLLNNNQELVVGHAGGNGTLVMKCGDIKIIAGHEYSLSLLVYSTLSIDVDMRMYESSETTLQGEQIRFVALGAWKLIKMTFTALNTDDNGVLWLNLPATAVYQFRADRVRIYDLTKEKKEYRLMRIQGSMRPGSFVQTLTLREKTAAESA